jgi:GT2 family glycosyltransferase
VISFVTCPRDDGKLRALQENLQQAFATAETPAAEFVFRHHPTSLAAAYREALAASKGEVVVFLHDDVLFLSAEALTNLSRHVEKYDVVGIAGSMRATSGEWTDAGPPFLYGQVMHPLPAGSVTAQGVTIYGAPTRVMEGAALVDGCVVAFRREVIEGLGFDGETLPGFDLVATEAAYRAGLGGARVAIACDVAVWHEGGGRAREARWPGWHAAVAAFDRKHGLMPERASYLPAIVPVQDVGTALSVMRPAFWG